MSNSRISFDNTIYSEVDEAMNKEIAMIQNGCYECRKPAENIPEDHEDKPEYPDDKVDSIKPTAMFIIVLFIFMIALLLGAIGACVAFALEISKLKSAIKTPNSSMQQEKGSRNLSHEAFDDMIQELNAQLSQVFDDMIQELNSSLSMQLNQDCEEFSNGIQELNSSIRTKLNQDHEMFSSGIQELNTSINIQLNQDREQNRNGIYVLNTSINIQLNQDREQFSNDIQELNTSLGILDNRTLQIFSTLSNLGQNPTYPTVDSCAALLSSSPSGYYMVRATNGSAVRVYCDMTRSCGGVTGGWMRIAHLDMTNSSHQCPSSLRQRNDSNISTCIQNRESAGCSSLNNFASSVNRYSMVCGRIIGYQIFSTDAFYTSKNIDVAYVDGVSLTHGIPRQHIWTFAAAHDSGNNRANCPCIKPSRVPESLALPPSFVGDDYFCAVGTDFFNQNIFYGANPLWDGVGCMHENICCSFNSPPWFYKQLAQPTTDDIEVRVCRDEVRSNEDVAIEMIELFVQ